MPSSTAARTPTEPLRRHPHAAPRYLREVHQQRPARAVHHGGVRHDDHGSGEAAPGSERRYMAAVEKVPALALDQPQPQPHTTVRCHQDITVPAAPDPVQQFTP
nr:hypothetical protein [Streptomyces clavuligerus]